MIGRAGLMRKALSASPPLRNPTPTTR
jgi:hypothetical protein